MLRAIFDLFEITESQLSKGALMRLRIAGILGLLALPLGIAKISQHGVMNLIQLNGWNDYALLISLIAFIVVASTRAVNRLFIPDAYLDESEIGRKRQVNGLVFGVLITVTMALLLILLGLFLSGVELSLNLKNGHQIVVFMLGILVPICCLQGLILSFIAKPLNDDNSSIAMTARDYKYLVVTIGFVGIFTALGLIAGH